MFRLVLCGIFNILRTIWNNLHKKYFSMKNIFGKIHPMNKRVLITTFELFHENYARGIEGEEENLRKTHRN